ncbi:hypothetical protein LTR60_000911 [Cryomyces antarcticus]|nr:hypothetical protein LTR60_003757 [Cryomyces antarcticus]KAK5020023.1 hypothetical protein LTR60_000911 [Cryomyces antarcticus]KAK5148949.1 hypothetical protein LTR04_000284 [Oleoguttula sp. CCFEE 6159]
MPVYLLHGFRWPRPLIRIHIILQNLDDAAAEWLLAPPTTNALLANFRHLYPQLFPALSSLRFVEQYDPLDLSPASTSQPYAYVADMVEEVKLGVDVDEVRGRGVGNEQWSAMMELRDKLAPGEKVAWFVVVCGDEERWAPPTVGLLAGGGHSGHWAGEDSIRSSSVKGPGSLLSETGSAGYGAENGDRLSNELTVLQRKKSSGPFKKWFGSQRSLEKPKR